MPRLRYGVDGGFSPPPPPRRRRRKRRRLPPPPSPSGRGSLFCGGRRCGRGDGIERGCCCFCCGGGRLSPPAPRLRRLRRLFAAAASAATTSPPSRCALFTLRLLRPLRLLLLRSSPTWLLRTL